jgi:hypothetical protein
MSTPNGHGTARGKGVYKSALAEQDLGGDNDTDIPSAMLSEQRIAEMAPSALSVLESRNASDLAEMLGLS